MKTTKMGLGILITGVVLIFSGVVTAQGLLPAQVVPNTEPVVGIMVLQQAIEHSRVIRVIIERPVPSGALQRCKVIHELNDAVAVECPAGVQIAGAFEDEVYHIMDMDSNVQIGATNVWAMEPSITGEGVIVAVLDTGIDTNHQELGGDVVGGRSFVKYTTSYEDDNGHGTHVSGIITADGVETNAKGAAPNAGVWMGKVCDSGGSCYVTDIAAGIEYIVNNNTAGIISISLGGGGTGGPNCNKDYLAKKVNWAVDNGVTVVAAAGNTASVVASPACASGAIAVGAVDKYDRRASFSGIGKALDIMAPGVSIYSSVIDGKYASWNGTSMATPHVSATVALMKEKNPTWIDADIKEALYNTAVDLGYKSREQGNGRVDALGAVTYTGETPPPPTECIKDGRYCNCNNRCDKFETLESCPWDCPQ